MAGILISKENFITTLSIDNPTEKNALTNQLLTELKAAVLSCYEDDCKVIVLKGVDGNFSAGASLKGARDLSKLDLEDDLRTYHNPLIMAMRNCPKPIIAQVEGVCVGVGFSYALACDLVYVANDCRMSMIFTQIGLSADGGGSYFLVQRLGYHRALEMMMTAEMISGEKAAEIGIVNAAYPKENLAEAVAKMTDFLATGPSMALAATKKNARVAEEGSLEDVLDMEAVNQGHNGRSKDFLEGVMAFLQKRKANFRGE